MCAPYTYHDISACHHIPTHHTFHQFLYRSTIIQNFCVKIFSPIFLRNTLAIENICVSNAGWHNDISFDLGTRPTP